MAVWEPSVLRAGSRETAPTSRALVEAIRAMFAELGVPHVGAAIERLSNELGMLAEEAPAVRHASTRRRIEFAAGRRAARSALEEIGVAPGAVPRGPGGSPSWPEGVTGSISHAQDVAAAVTVSTGSARSVGLDIELSQSLDEDLWGEICTPGELASIRALPATERGSEALRVFGAKEAGYKCQYPLTGNILEMSAASVHFKGDTGRFRIEFHQKEHDLGASFQLRGISRFVREFTVSVACLVEVPSPALSANVLNGTSIAGQ